MDFLGIGVVEVEQVYPCQKSPNFVSMSEKRPILVLPILIQLHGLNVPHAG